MSDHIYQRDAVGSGWDVIPLELSREVELALPALPFRLAVGYDRAEPRNLRFRFRDTLDAAQVGILDAAVAAYKAAADPLAPLRERRAAAVRAQTARLIELGVEYPPASGTRIRADLDALERLRGIAQVGAFPASIPQVAPGPLVVLADVAAHTAALDAVQQRREQLLQGEDSLAEAIRLAASEAALAGVVDGRA